MSHSKTSSLLAGGFFLACSLLTSQAALLIHYSFDGETPGSLSTGEVIANLGTSGTDGTVGIPSGSITVSADANRVNGVAGELGNYLNFQPGADDNEGVNSTHITSGSSLSSLGIDGNTNYSMMAWVKFDNSLSDNMVFGGNSGGVIHLGARGNSYWSGHWGDDINSSGSPTINAGNWHHVTWTNSGTTQGIFVDGVSVAAGGGGSSGAFSGNLSENLLIGTSRNGGSFRGSLDDVAVFSTLLNDSQIAAFHTLSTNVDYGYNAGEVDQMITAHQAGAGSSVAVGDTTWEYVVSDPSDGRYFIQLDSGGSGLAGSTGPPVREFLVDHPLIPAGNPIVLSWDVGINATSLSIDQGVGDILPLTTGGIGQITLDPGPSGATTYTITASNADGVNMAQVTVNITNQPIIESFTADQILVAPGTSVELDWSTLNVTALDLNGSNVTGTTSLSVNPATTTTYTLNAINGKGVNTSQLTVTVIIPGEPIINEVSATKQSILLDEDGESTDWIEVYNPSGSTAILNDYYLSDDPSFPTKWRLPDMNLAPGGFLMIFASGKDRAVAGSELHTNFSLRAGGEYLALSKVDGGVTTFLSEFNPYPNQFEDITWGYFQDGNTLGYFTTPTPGSPNPIGAIDYVRDTSFSLNRGFYTAPISVAITSNTPSVDIRYTTDGSAPTSTTGILYTGPIGISSTTVLRAIAYRTGYLPTNVDTNTYIFLDDVITQSETAPTGWPASGTFNGQLYNYGMDSDIVNSGNSAIGGVQEVKDALSAIPSISISLRQDDFSGSNGIFSNPGNRGIAWERPASAELIFPTGYVDPDGNLKGFQVDAGLRVRGGFSRSGSNPKHALRLLFRAEYGDSKLRFPIFGDEGVDEFDNLDLRTSQNYSWAFQNDPNRNTFLREVFSRDTQRDMGQPYTRSRYYHIYINGIYWGLYMTQERAEASYAETYFGGDKANYDTVKSAGSSGGYTNEATDGNLNAWQDIFDMGRNLVDPGFVNKRAEYYKMQGLDSNGVRDTNLPVLIDMDNLIDFLLVTFWVGNFDAPLSNFLGNDRPNNFFSLRDRTNNDMGFAFYAHDAEHSLFSGWDRTGPFNSSNRAVFAYSNPQFLHEDLLQNLDSFSRNEYLMAWADRTHKALFNDGVLTTASATARINSRASIVDQVIVAESARWGDAKGANPPHDRNDWIVARNSLLGIVGGRNSTVLGQLIADGLYPTLAAPEFSQHGGHVLSTTELTMSNNSGTIYYTTDGSDPRLTGGALNPNAKQYDGSISTTTLVAAGSVWKYLDNGTDQGTAWREPAFNDNSWDSGAAEMGYGDGPEVTTVSYGPNENQKYRTTYFRREFNVDDPNDFDSLSLELQRDDGAIVYLNGKLVFSSNMPTSGVIYTTPASSVVGGNDETTFFSKAVDVADLVVGTNTFAVEVHQVSDTSSDISFDLRFRGAKSNAVDPFQMTESGMLRARARDGADWSALNEAFFFVATAFASDTNLVISEFNYRPLPPSPTEEAAGFNERSDFEYIELTNIASSDIDLTNVQFSAGVDFNFSDALTGVILPAGGRILLVNNFLAFTSRYPDVPESLIAGEFSGSLSNDGEAIELLAGNTTPIRSFTYNDQFPWPTSADGDGYSLVLINPNSNPDHAEATNWRASVATNGNPGGIDSTTFPGPDPLADADRDGTNALLEYALTSSDSIANDSLLPSSSITLADLGGGDVETLSFVFLKNIEAEDLIYEVQLSPDLIDWDTDPAEVIHSSSVNNGDGTSTETYLIATPLNTEQKSFIRLHVSQK